MDIGTVLSAAQTLFAALQCSELKEICSILGYQSELEKLECTVNTIKAVLLDAESKQEEDLSHQARLWIDELKDAIYDADDLLDEFVTLAEQNQLINSGNAFRKVCLLFSCMNSLGFARKLSQGVKRVRNKLEAIASNHNNFGFKLDCRPLQRRRDETCSYVHSQNIIGRDNDVEKVVTLLLDPDVRDDVAILAIVGIGGLGKTTLAQLVYNHPRIGEGFPSRFWTCVSDQGPKHWDVKATLCKILHSTTGQNHEHLAMDHLQQQLQQRLGGKKFLIVLDDVWNEDRGQWLKLADFLMCGLKGSWIILTTRSELTARAVGDEHTYKLKGLSDEDSWCLFLKAAFRQGDEQVNPPELVEIGKMIVKRCANVPLAIKVVGSLLYGQDKENWLLFRKIKLGRITRGENGGIEHILKFSYHHLEFPLKVCFSYCAVFPKNFVIEKEMLISLWMAQGYIVPLNEHQSIEDAGEEYFSILLRRCFFHDVINNEYGEIIYCKVHDLMHDIAQEVAGKEIYATNSITANLDTKIRHLSHLTASEAAIKSYFTRTRIRTYLQFDRRTQHRPEDTLLANWVCLRALDLSSSRIKSLPSTLGKLLHLRFLDLSRNYDLKVLPKSIVKLHNLQILKLQQCLGLKELPRDLNKLVNLKVLDIAGCWKLNIMPQGMRKLSNLQKLTSFVVAVVGNKNTNQLVDQLEDLKALTNLKGGLHILIKILNKSEYANKNGREGEYIRRKQHLKCIIIHFYSDFGASSGMWSYEERLMEDLQPHPNVREYEVYGYSGRKMPVWAMEDNLSIFLPNLVRVELGSCNELEYLGSLRKLLHLKSLVLKFLRDLEYLENDHGGSTRACDSEVFFPALVRLTLEALPKLKKWCKSDDQRLRSSSFSCVSFLNISECPNLTYIPSCPNVQQLDLSGKLSEELRINIHPESINSRLMRVITGNVRCFNSILPMEAFQSVKYIDIVFDEEIESLSEVEDVFRSCSSSLRSLKINSCSKLENLCSGLKHLTALESLHIGFVGNLDLTNAEEGDDNGGIPWRCLHKSLRFLCLQNLPQIVNFPEGMHCLTTLQTLRIFGCGRLESIPESIRDLISLKELSICGCSAGLKQRCQNPNGEDWSNIQHIPHIAIALDYNDN